MLQHKDINKLSELKNGFTQSWVESDFIYRSLKCFSFSKLNKGLCLLKTKGYGFDWVLSILISLSFIKMVEIYQTRWTIEVFFKESKQLLRMGSCQSNDFDAQIADTTITMLQHLLLTLRYRYGTYESTGALFEQVKETTAMLKLNERLWGLFVEILQILECLFEVEDEMTILQRIINNDHALTQIKKLFELGVDMDNAA